MDCVHTSYVALHNAVRIHPMSTKALQDIQIAAIVCMRSLYIKEIRVQNTQKYEYPILRWMVREVLKRIHLCVDRIVTTVTVM